MAKSTRAVPLNGLDLAFAELPSGGVVSVIRRNWSRRPDHAARAPLNPVQLDGARDLAPAVSGLVPPLGLGRIGVRPPGQTGPVLPMLDHSAVRNSRLQPPTRPAGHDPSLPWVPPSTGEPPEPNPTGYRRAERRCVGGSGAHRGHGPRTPVPRPQALAAPGGLATLPEVLRPKTTSRSHFPPPPATARFYGERRRARPNPDLADTVRSDNFGAFIP